MDASNVSSVKLQLNSDGFGSYKCSVDLQLHISLVVTLQSTGAESVSVEIVPTRHRENKVFWNFLVRARVTVLMARSRC